MFIFGGGDARRALNDLHVLDLSCMAWSRPSDTGVMPSPRAGHAAASVGTFIAIFGGASPDGTGFNDLHLLDTAYSPYGGLEGPSENMSSRRRGAPFDGSVGSDAELPHSSSGQVAHSFSLVTQSDNESRLSSRVPVSRVHGVHSARLTVNSLDSKRPTPGTLSWGPLSGVSAISTSGPLLSLSEVPSRSVVSRSVEPSALLAFSEQHNPVRLVASTATSPAIVSSSSDHSHDEDRSVEGHEKSGLHSSVHVKEQLLAFLDAHQRADEERFRELLGQLEQWRRVSRSDIASMKRLIEQLT